MKQTKLLMLAMALGASGAMAQSVVVVLNDGTQQKFATDYVKEIYFTEESGPGDEVPLMLTDKNVYSNGNVLMSFSPATLSFPIICTHNSQIFEYLQNTKFSNLIIGIFIPIS